MNQMEWAIRPVFAGIQALLLLILPMLMPVLVPLQMAAPLPVLLTALWGGPRAGWMGASVPVIGALLLSEGILFPFTTFLLFFGFPLLAAWLVRGGWKASHCLGVAYLLGIGVLLLFFVWVLLSGIDFETEITLKLNEFKPAIMASMTASIAKKGVDPVFLAEFKNGLDALIHILSLLLPSLVLSGWFLLHTGNLLAARRLVAKRVNVTVFAPEDLTNWRIPFKLVWVFLGTGLLAYVTEGFPKQLGANLFFLVAMLYFFQGMAIVQTGFRHYSVAGVGRGIFYFALIVWSSLVLIVMVLGLFDIWVDFRKRFFSTCKEGENSPGS
ncbi:MAG: YybS family protein [Magnetococcus sp. YQC-5]